MTDQDTVFVQQRREFYQNHYRGTEPIDRWHAYAQNMVHSTTREWFFALGTGRKARILNAGSGGSDYCIGVPMVHLDLIADRIAKYPGFLVADISKIPQEDSSFDVVLCVGSVLNYGNPMRGIGEFWRVLRPGGFLILEYERSGSPEYWWKHGFASACARVDTFYGRVETQLWAYGDQFIDGLLAIHGFKRVKEIRFHGLSSVILAVTGMSDLAARCVWGDKYTASQWPIRYVASNRMLAVEKPAHQRNE